MRKAKKQIDRDVEKFLKGNESKKEKELFSKVLKKASKDKKKED